MKNIKNLAVISLLSVAALFVGCTKEKTPTTPKPNIEFPTSVDVSAEVDSEYTIEFDAAVNWSATTDVSWIMFVEGSDLYSSTSGKAGDNIELKFKVDDSEFDFNDDLGNITLSMGGKSAVIAKVSREGKTPSIVFYSLDPNTYEEYEVDPNEPFDIPWNNINGGFNRKLYFKTNFDWVVEGLPAWISNPANNPIATAGSAGVPFSTILITDFRAYTSEAQMEATISIKSELDPEINYSLTLTTRGAKDLMVLTASDSYHGFLFDADGTYSSQMDGIVSTNYDFSYVIAGNPAAAPAFTISCSADSNGGYFFDSNSDWASSWAYVDEIDVDVKLGDNLTEVTRTISVSANSGAENRSAAIFAIPESLYNNYMELEDFFDANYNLKPELEQYIIGYVDQKGSEGVSLDFAWENPSRTATITKMDSDNPYFYHYLYEYSVPADAIFVLEYQEVGAEQIKFPFEFNWDTDAVSFKTITTPLVGEEAWLGVEPADTYFSVMMNASQLSEGSVILKRNSLNVVAIHCVQNTK